MKVFLYIYFIYFVDFMSRVDESCKDILPKFLNEKLKQLDLFFEPPEPGKSALGV